MREASQFVDRHLQFPLRVIDGSGKHGVGASAGTALGGALIVAGSFRASIALAIVLGFGCALLVAGYARGAQLDD